MKPTSTNPAGPARTDEKTARSLPWAVLLLAGCLGCGGAPPETPLESPDPTVAATEGTSAGPSFGTDREIWEVLRIGGVRVGYATTRVSHQTLDGAKIVRTDGLSRMHLMRAGEQVDLVVRFNSLERPDGRLLEFDSEISQADAPIQQSRGRVSGDNLQIEIATQGHSLASSIPWSEDYKGPYAVQLGLLEHPMEPGHRRTIRALVPGANVVGTVELVARDYEPVELLGETRRLLRIDTTTTFPDGQRQRGTLWTDRSGDALRSHEEALNLESIRAAKSVALEASGRAEFDLVLGLSIKVDRRLENPHETKRIRYLLRLEGDDPADVFPTGPTQHVRSLDPHTAEVTVYAVRPDQPAGSDAPDDPPTDGDLEPNNFIQSDDPKIVAAARRVAGQQRDPWQVAVALERYVAERMTLVDYSQAFDTAAEVIQTGQGDCTEHAVLLAALARASGIPARVVIGLVYFQDQDGPAFWYHMWNEVHIADRWIPLDATVGRGGIGAAHLKLTHSDLQGASAFTSFLPVAQVAGRLRIEIREVQ